MFWYTREKEQQDLLQDERQAVKRREEELMMEALGLKPKAAPRQAAQQQLEKHELQALLRKGEVEQGEEHGLGYGK